jgi:hypothetical protein
VPFSFTKNSKENSGIKHKIPKAGSHRISYSTPTKVKRYTFRNCPKHQNPEDKMLKIKTTLLVFEFLNGIEVAFIHFKLIH